MSAIQTVHPAGHETGRPGTRRLMTHDDDEKHDPPPATDTTGQGYPEESQPGTGIDARDHAEDDVTPDADDAPQSKPERDGDPSQATGNPNAAGG